MHPKMHFPMILARPEKALHDRRMAEIDVIVVLVRKAESAF